MSAKKTPHQRMIDVHGDKEKLVDRVLAVLPAGEDGAEARKQRLLGVSNKKLLRLLEIGVEIKEKYGSADGLAEAAARAAGKGKDAAYVERLKKIAARTPARVYDLLKASEKKGAGKAA